MSDETRPLDPTRRQLRIFGVTVTNYEERTAVLLEQLDSSSTEADRLQAARQIAALTAELNDVLRATTNHVVEIENRVLTALADGG